MSFEQIGLVVSLQIIMLGLLLEVVVLACAELRNGVEINAWGSY